MRSLFGVCLFGILLPSVSCLSSKKHHAAWPTLDARDGILHIDRLGYTDSAIDQAKVDGVTDATYFGSVDAGTTHSADSQPLSRINFVNNQTLDGLFVTGYQGWFTYPRAPPGMPRWVHWTSTVTPPAPDTIHFDAWPDLSEFTVGELQDTSFKHTDGRVAGLYSAATPATVDRHMRWAKEYEIDGFFLQRFLNEVTSDPVFKLFRDTVAKNFLTSVQTHGRVFAIEYDISGAKASWLEDLKKDWQFLVDTLKVTASDRYLHHRGLPLLVIWA